MNRTRTSKMSRADIVRQRQNERSQQRISQSKKSALNGSGPRKTTPIHTRGVVSGFNYPPPVQQRARKQYYYSVGTSGTEIRMPALPSIQFGWRFISFLLLAAAVAGIYFLMNAPFLQVESITINGIHRISTAEVEAELDFMGKSVVMINPQKSIETLAAAFPELYEIELEVELPNLVTINAIERQPVMAWQTEQTTYWVDQEGVLIPPRGEISGLITIYANLDPIILPKLEALPDATETATVDAEKADEIVAKVLGTDPQWGDQINVGMIQAANQLQAIIPAGTNIIFDKTHGMGWRAEQGWDVFIGLTLTDIAYKLKAYNILIDKLNTEGITPMMVSVEYAHAPFYRE